jgi:hypothetical protein
MTGAIMNTTNLTRDLDEPQTPEPVVLSAQSLEEALYAIADEKRFKMCLTDDRGRRFTRDFYVDDAPAVQRFAVWGYSASGAGALEAWTKGAARGPKGNRVRNGWGNPRNAQRVAEQLNDAAANWCAAQESIPASKRTQQRAKNRK